MKLLKVVFIVVAACVSISSEALAIRPGTQPRMENAVDALIEARDSKDPLPLLEKAEKLVRRGENKINERREDGAEAIHDAIEAVKKGEDPKAKITKAIAILHAAENRRKSSNVK